MIVIFFDRCSDLHHICLSKACHQILQTKVHEGNTPRTGDVLAEQLYTWAKQTIAMEGAGPNNYNLGQYSLVRQFHILFLRQIPQKL